jgi:hypothetical protein
MRKWLLLVVVFWATPALAYEKYQNWCQQGNQQVHVSGNSSSDRFQRSFATCTITVYQAGTVTLATLYSDNSSTALGNPFTNQSTGTGQFFFFAPNGYYDIQISATGLTTFTLSNVAIGGAGGTRINCSNYPGANAGFQMSNAYGNIASTGGVIDCSGVLGAQSISADPFTSMSNPTTVITPVGTMSSSVSLTIPATVTLAMPRGSIFCPAMGTTITINGNLVGSSLSTHFSTACAGTIVINSYIDYPEWFGAVADNSTDNATAIQAAINAFNGKTNPYSGNIGPSGGGFAQVQFTSGVYVYKSALTMQQSGVQLVGSGVSATMLRFQPASGPAIGITISASGSVVIHDMGIYNMTLDGTGSSLSVVKTALKTVDIQSFKLQNVNFRDFSDSTHASLCWDLHGQATYDVNAVEGYCNRALYIGNDPNSTNEGLDNSTFKRILFVNSLSLAEGSTVLTDHPVVEISQQDAFLTNVSFDDFDFIGGSYSVYWIANDTKTSGSYAVAFRNGRNEQGPVGNWAFYHAPPQYTTGLEFDNVTWLSATKGGWYLRNVGAGLIHDSSHQAVASVGTVDADSTVHMSFRDINWNIHSAGIYTALNGWCGERVNQDNSGAGFGDGVTHMRSCGTPQMTLESQSGGTTYSITAASCSGSLLTYSVSNAFEFSGTITVSGVTPAGLNGVFDIVSANSTTVTVVNDQCPLTYSSGGTNAMTYGPPSYIGTNSVVGAQVAGDLAFRSDGARIFWGFNGLAYGAWNSGGYQEFYNAAGSTVKGYIGSRNAVLSGWATDDLQIRSDAAAIRFGFNGATDHIMTSNTLSINNGTNPVYRCVTAGGTLPAGTLTINAAACGSTQDTGLRVP